MPVIRDGIFSINRGSPEIGTRNSPSPIRFFPTPADPQCAEGRRTAPARAALQPYKQRGYFKSTNCRRGRTGTATNATLGATEASCGICAAEKRGNGLTVCAALSITPAAEKFPFGANTPVVIAPRTSESTVSSMARKKTCSGASYRKGSPGWRQPGIAAANDFATMIVLEPAERRQQSKLGRATARVTTPCHCKRRTKTCPAIRCREQRGDYFDDSETGPAAASWSDLSVSTTYDGKPMTLK